MLAVTELRPHEKVILIAVKKRSLDDESTRRLYDDVLTAAAARPALPVVLDMTRVRFAPSVALGQLVQLSKGFSLDGRRLALFGIDERVMDAIRVTQLHQVLEIHGTLEQVLATL